MTVSSRPLPPVAADALRLPSVDRLLAHEAVAPLLARHGRAATLDALRDALGEARASARAGATALASAEALAAAAAAALEALFTPSLKPVFNMTGTVLHTNLGRALLPPEAGRAVADVLTKASNLEFDLAAGKRGERDDHVEGLIRRLTGAEAATIVNNNAAAVLLVLGALGARKEVLVSRGELVEIGGAFRVPDVMAQAGCKMREVGTTNRTHLRDFAEAIGPRTVAIMKVHQSNYEIRGFTAAVAEADLAGLCKERGLILMDDLGSGNLIDLSLHGLPREPTVGEALRHADVVTFSGDKLLGGVQCGIIAGRADLIAKIRKHPLKRALRVDKMTIAAMEAVLRLYLEPDRLASSLPTLRMLTRSQAEIRAQAERIAPGVAAVLAGVAIVSVVDCASQIGSGALPVESLPSAAIALSRPKALSNAKTSSSPKTVSSPTTLAGARSQGEGRWLAALAARLRAAPMPIIGRVAEGALLLDCRTLSDETGFLRQLAATKTGI